MSFSPSHTSVEPAALAPHTPLQDYYGDEDEHRDFVRRIFDATAPVLPGFEAAKAFEF